MKKPTAPRLTKRVAFDAREQIDDGYGNHESAFVERFKCWAAFTYLRGSEAVMAARLEGRQPVVVRVRRTAQTEQIDHNWQMRHAGEAYAVRSIIPSEDNRWVDVTVERGVAA